MGFSLQQKRELVVALRKLRRDKRTKSERLTFQDIQDLIWELPPSRYERFIDSLHKRLTRFQGK